MSDPDAPSGLKPTDFHVLLALADGPRHGYGIMKAVELESAGAVRLEVGTLYRVLARLLDEGLLRETGGDGRRRNYGLTPLGRETLASEAARLATLVARLRARKLVPRANG
jgi:DNA-binding PadR family transcriptional regulator